MAGFPAKLKDWEELLCRAYLQVSGSGNLLPITSFEITSHRLAQISIDRTDDESAKQALAAFKGAFSINKIRLAFENGWYEAMPDLPGCFSYLALTLLVENALDDQNKGAGAFRDKLSTFLDSDHQFVEITGIAEMWRRLEKWLRERAATYDDYRVLQLPDAKSWVQIGYTKRLAFPAKNDIIFGRRVLKKHEKILDHPSKLISLFENRSKKAPASKGLPTHSAPSKKNIIEETER
ncbi:hypothetical protein M2323_001766 [Rhodoblastus acidophilus]|uniref:hypothetical protein n=1 Tax=Rhodoblastus acidophilus TaxID=1074 RepID=UPI00222410F2|nr:hypothetical protein [Rhodoblastus acidophilus]MCW2283802.1 hypothetical protein [Rhodoblastus acidophilus]MCW2332849.1 hypothetical protein [Rhodoblastus acidophilus]